MNKWKKAPRVFFHLILLVGMLAGVSIPAPRQGPVHAAPMRACPATTIAQWTFLGDVTTPSTSINTATFANGAGVTPSFLTGNPDSAISFTGWTTAAVLDPSDYVEFSVDTTSYSDIRFSFDYRATPAGPLNLDLQYSIDGLSFTSFGSTALNRDSNFHLLAFDLSSIPLLNNNSNAKFRLYGYNAGGGNLRLDNVTISDICGLPPAGAGNVSIVNQVNDADTINSNVCANVVFKLTVRNDGATDVNDVQVLDVLPAQLIYISHTSGMTYNRFPGIWEVGTLLAGESKTLSITAKLVASGTITNQAEVLSSTSANNIDNSIINSAAGTNSDLQVTQAWTRSTSAAGTANLTITVLNNGPDPATGVKVEDKLPSGLTYVSYTATSGTSYSSSSGVWSVGNLSSGGSASLTIVVRVAQDGDATDNEARIYSTNQCDLNPANDATSNEVFVSDLNVTQVVDISGSNAVFTIKVSNNGPDDASNIGIKNSQLATGYPYVSHGVTAGTYNNATGDWTIPILLDGESATLTVTTTYSSLAVNWAQISVVTEVDPDSIPGNCSNTMTSCVEDDDAGAPSADLTLTQSVSTPNPDVSSLVTFTVTVANAGTADTTGVQVRNVLPSGLTYVSNDQGTSYNQSTGIWTVGAMSSGASRSLSITAKVTSHGVFTNYAEVWKSDQDDPDSKPGNNSTTEDDDASVAVTSHRSILINEVAWGGTAASADDEWIELYNPSSATITLTNWILKSASGSVNITLSGSLGAGGYFLLERDDNSTVSDVSANQLYTGALSDSGDVLTLLDASGNFVDTANGDGGVWPQGSALEKDNYASMERRGITTDNDERWATNRGLPKNGYDAEGGPIYGTPKKANSTGVQPTPTAVVPAVPTIPAVGRPIINEFLARPGFDWNQDGKVDVFDEFIEIKNIGVVDISIGGWKLDDEANQGSAPFTLPTLTLKPGQYAIFYGLQTNILLSDGGDTVRLLNASDKVYDAYTYTLADVEDRSVCRLPDGNGIWYEDCVPTPNRLNSREGEVPTMPEGEAFESPVCDMPDTLHPDFLFAECRGYGDGIWRYFFWDQFGWMGEQPVPENTGKRQSFVE